MGRSDDEKDMSCWQRYQTKDAHSHNNSLLPPTQNLFVITRALYMSNAMIKDSNSSSPLFEVWRGPTATIWFDNDGECAKGPHSVPAWSGNNEGQAAIMVGFWVVGS